MVQWVAVLQLPQPSGSFSPQLQLGLQQLQLQLQIFHQSAAISLLLPRWQGGGRRRSGRLVRSTVAPLAVLVGQFTAVPVLQQMVSAEKAPLGGGAVG